MCGFTGFLSKNKFDNNSSIDILNKMSKVIESRGPDDYGYYYDGVSGIGLAHRRLSILDLSDAGKQPMISKNNRYMIVFNGEIYNHLYLRKLLKKNNYNVSWLGHSDTETLLESFSFFGIAETLKLCVGMFSLAIWDQEYNELILTRDRFGEKPLYYGWLNDNSSFLFGSDLNSFKQNPNFNCTIDINSLQKFMQYSYVPTPYTIYKNIFKLSPGKILKVSLKNPMPLISDYWSIENAITNSKNNLFQGTLEEATDELENILINSVHDQMISDVPIGAFLSGGIDSSLIVSLMQLQSKSKVKTFTIGFNESQYNEAFFAKKIAKHLGTDHNELYLSSSDSLNIIPSLSTIYSEPFADSSQIPMILVSKFAKSNVTVCLSGDGGDELFGGYSRYSFVNSNWRNIEKAPQFLKTITSRLVMSVPNLFYDKAFSNISKNKINSYRIKKVANLILQKELSEFYSANITHWNTESIVKNSAYTSYNDFDEMDLSNIEKMMYCDTKHYLLDDILTKVDRATMSVSLESRVPFLDHRVFEFAWKLPFEMKLKGNKQKLILTEILKKHVPESLFLRPKMGFGIPLDSWLRGPLREWCESLLNESRIEQEGYLNAKLVSQTWKDFLRGSSNNQYKIWNILMFESWLDNNRK